jgi:pimeloyl-ACP methyl ester carboxylesterase
MEADAMRLEDGEELIVRHGAVAAKLLRGRRLPVLLLHGNSSCKEVFTKLWASLAERGHTLLACDLPGHGASDNAADPACTYTLPGYAAVVADVLSAAEVPEALVVGWSLGGHVAMEAMLTEPRLVAGFVVGSPPGRPCGATFEAAFSQDPTTRLAGKTEFTERDARDYVGAMLGTDKPDAFFVDVAMRTDGRARRRLMESVAEEIGADQRLAAVGRPLCVCVGGDDPFVNLDYFRALDPSTFWRNQVHILPGVGHAPHFQASAAFEALLKEFIEAVELRKCEPCH